MERKPVNLDRAGLGGVEHGSAGEIRVHTLADSQDHGIALEALDFFGRDRFAASGGVKLTEPSFDNLNAFEASLLADYTVRRSKENEMRSFRFRGGGFLGDGGHILPLAPVRPP